MTKTSSSEIWLVLDSRQFGGIETHVLQLAQGLIQYQQTVKVWLICAYTPASPLCAKLEQLGIHYAFLGQGHSSALVELIDQIKQCQPDVVHAHGYRASLLTKMAKLRTRCTQISTYHAGETPRGKVRMYDWLDRYSAFISDRSIAVSHGIKAKIPSHSCYFDNFIDCQDVPFSHGQRIAFVGRLSEEKAPERFCRLAQAFPNELFDIFGEGPLEKVVQDLAPGNTTCHGYQPNMNASWPTLSVLVICSHFEGLPMVALEAMARGIVVIAFPVGELPRLINDGVNGWIADSEPMLAKKLADWLALSDDAKSAIRVNAANTILQHHSQSAIIPKMITFYRNSGLHLASQIEN